MDINLINNAINHLSKNQQENVKKYVLDEISNGHLYEETHLHSKDQFRSDNPPKHVLARYKELGMKSLSLTQNGVVAMTWEYKPLVLESGLKFIPGVESDYQATATKDNDGLMVLDTTQPYSQLVFHALNDDGWKAIGMALSDSQTVDGKSLMSEMTLNNFFGKGTVGYGNVIATTSNINGPITQFYKENIIANKKISNILSDRNKKTGGEVSKVYLEKLSNKILELENERDKLSEVIKETKKTANTNFSRREKLIKSLKDKEGEFSDVYIEAYLRFSEDRKVSKQANLSLPKLNEELKRIKRRISALNKEKNGFLKLDEENKSYQLKIDEVNAKITQSDKIDEKAEKEEFLLDKIFGHGFLYVEIQNHGSEEQRNIFPKVVNLARKNKIPLLASNDVYTTDNSDEEYLKLQILKTTEFPKNPKWFELAPYEKERYIKSGEDIKISLSKIFDEDVVEEAMMNTLVVTYLSNVEFKVVNHHPKFIDETNRTSDEIFESLIEEGIKKRFPNGLDEEHQKRLEHEVNIMKSMGYVDYHLVVNDFNQYASEYDAIPFDKIKEAPLNRKDLKEWKEKNGYTTPVGLTNGTGRGSAVGSLVCDLLSITHLDPIRYQLLFERFLNPERVSMPDIDSDISRTVRPIVIKYVMNKYGKDCVAGIVTQNAQAPRGAIRIAAKAYGLYVNKDNYKNNGSKQFLSLSDEIAKAVPSTPGISFDSKISDNDEQSVYDFLLKEYSTNNDAIKIIEWAKIFEGCFTSYGSHAAGIVITDGVKVSEIVPLRWNKKLGLYTTQCDMIIAEELGMLKFDMLGLKTVDVINDTLWEMNKSGIVMDTNELPLDDKEVYANIFAKGKTDSIFQFESDGMKKMLKRFQPENFEDLIILVSMFRPGPLQYLDDVIDVKHKRKALTFLTPELEPILGATYGAITYQEQVMQIFQQLAGYTLGGADLVRRYMSKKKADKLAKEKEAFVYGDEKRSIKGCVNNGIDEKAASDLFDQMTDFAKYAFNKSHAAAYAYNAYITGYLKYHYPAEFMMSAMRWAEKKPNHDPIPSLMAEAKSLGIEVYPPDINHSGESFNVENGRILFGLGSVASVASYSKEIIEERKNGKFIDFFDYFKRTKAKKDATKNLILSGAFDCFYDNRRAMIDIVDEVQKVAKKIKDKKSFVRSAEVLLPFIDELKTDEEVKNRQLELGVHVEIKKVTTKKSLQKRIDNANKTILELEEEFNNFKVPVNITEDAAERMNLEKKFIGAYITGHPMDSFETNQSIGVPPILEVNETTKRIYGVISSLNVTKRKSDGKPMAFLTIEDKTGSLKVNVFTDAYSKNKNIIELGAVIIIDGYSKAVQEDYEEHEYIENEMGDEIKESYEFIANNLTFAKRKQNGYLLTVDSLVSFHIDEEINFRKHFESKIGSQLQIYDKKLNELRLMNYKVNSNVLSYHNVIEL